MTTDSDECAKTPQPPIWSVSMTLTIMAVCLVLPAFSEAATISVSDDYTTIQEAVNNASPGDEIVVDDGSYDESVDLGLMGSALGTPTVGDLTIRAANPLGATVDGGMGAAFRATGFAGNITVSGFVLDADAGVPTGVLSLINIDGVVTVLDNTFGPGYGGVGVLMAVSGSTVTTLEVRGNSFETPADNQDAVEIEITGAPSINLIAEDNTFTMLQDDGIKIDVQSPSGPAGPVILGRIINNTFNAAAGSGSPIDVDLGDTGSVGTSASIAIEDNQITSPLSQAILVDLEGAATTTSVIVRNNQITAPGNNGIFIDGGSASADIIANVLIDANTVTGTGSGAGIRMRPQDASTGSGGLWKVVLTGNTITSPTGEGILIDADANNGVYTLDLDISGNTVQTPGASAYQIDQAVSTVQLDQGNSASFVPATVIADNTNAGTPIVVTGTVTVAAGVIAAEDLPANLGDFVWSDTNSDGIQDGGEPGVHAVSVAIAGSVSVSTTSDVNGRYLFPALLPGSYTLTVSFPPESELSPKEQGGDFELDSNFDPADGQADVTFTIEDLSIDAGLRPFTPVSISGLVFEDLNGDGSPTGDPAFPMVTIELWRDGGDGTPDFGIGDDVSIDSTGSDLAGLFGFSNVGGGRYFVRQLTPAGTVQTTLPAVHDITTVSGVDVTGLVFGNIRIVDIAVTVVDSVDPVVAGSAAGNLTYTVTTTNNGPVDASGVVVSNVLTLPAGVARDSVTPSAGTVWTAPSTWTVGDLANGASATLTVVLTVQSSTAAGTDVISNTATITATTQPETVTDNNEATEATSVTRQVDIELTTTESIDPVMAGSGAGNLVYTVTAANKGPGDASGLTISETLTLPTGVTIDSVTPSGGSFADPTWTLGSLAAGASATLTVTLTVAASTTAGTDVIGSTATVTAVNETDTNAANDTSSVATSVTRNVDIEIAAAESIDPVIAGSGAGNLTYVVTATNIGPGDASGVTASNILTLPAGVAIDSITPSGATTWTDPTWTIGDLVNGASETLTLVLSVQSSAAAGTDVISTTATLTAVNEPETDTDNNSATEATSVTRRVDIELTTSGSIDPVVAGSGAGNLVYTVTATNNGPANATGLTVSEVLTLPAGASADSVVPSGAGSWAGPTWTIGDLASGASETLTVTLTVASSTVAGSDVIGSTATVTALNETDTSTANDTSTETTSVSREVDLEVSTTESIDPVVAGSGAGNLVYTVTATNNGPSDASGVTLSEILTLPEGVTVDSVTPSAGSFADPTWTLGYVAAGASETLTVTLTVDNSAAFGTNVIDSTATITAVNETDTSSANDSSSENTSVTREVDVEVTVAESFDPVVAGSGAGNLTYVVTATNNGPSDASGVTITTALTLPTGVTIDSVTPSGGSFADPTWTLGGLARGDSETLTVVLTVSASTASGTDVVDSTATVTAVNETDTVPANDSASELTSVTREIDLVLDKTGSPNPWSPGATLVYTLTITNQGPSDATGVEVTDTLPASVTLVSTSGCAEDQSGVPTCTLGTLAAGGSKQYTISVTVNPDPPPIITNTASVTATETELDAEDNTDDEETTTDTTPPTVTSLLAEPGAGELEACRTVLSPITSLRVIFSEPVRDPPGDTDSDDVTNPANYLVIGSGPDGDFSTAVCGGPLGDDEVVNLTAVSYDEPTRTATLATGSLPSSQVRLLVCGSTSIRDIAGNPLDGTGDGAAGDDFLRTFRSDPFNNFTNGHFDCPSTGLDGWSVSDPVEIIRDSDDADGSTISGSTQIMQLAANTLFEISQCVKVTPSTNYDIVGRMRLTTTSFISYSRSCEFFSTTLCGAPGTGLGNSINSDLMGGTGGTWIEVSDTMTTTAGASSARCAFRFTTPGGQNFTAGLDDLFFGKGDLIFSDGFESGGTTMWSLTTP